MALTKGTAPLGRNPSAAIDRTDDGDVLIFEPSHRRVRGRLADRTIVDTYEAKRLHETGELPVYYFPRNHVVQEVLRHAGSVKDPRKGRGACFDLIVGDQTAARAAVTWTDPPTGAEFLTDHIVFRFDAMDAWFEEDERIGVHPRDPYHRIDVIRQLRNGLGPDL